MTREWHAEYRRKNRKRILRVKKEGMRQARLDPEYRAKEYAQQKLYRERNRLDALRNI